MNKRLRPIPYPIGSKYRQITIKYFVAVLGKTHREALARIRDANQRARNTPRRNEKCGAKTRKGTPCRCKALKNGRCKFHGGLSTGPRTEEGKRTSAANLRKVDKS